MDVNFVGRNNFVNNAYRGNFNPRPFPNNSSNNYGNPYNNFYGNFNKMPSDFENSVKEFMNSQKNFNALLEEKMLKVDDSARNIDRLSLDVDSLKLRSIPPKHDINESLKAMRISVDESKERNARMRAKKDCFVKACSSNFYENKDEDLKVIDVSPIKSLFCNMILDNDEAEYDPPLPRRRSRNSEFLDLDAKIDKSGIENKTLDINEHTILDFKEFNYDNCSLIDCISLLQSVLNSPHAYSQNKAFTRHIVDALMQSHEENLSWKFLSLENSMMSGNLLLKLKLKIMNSMLCVIWVLVFPRFQRLCAIC